MNHIRRRTALAALVIAAAIAVPAKAASLVLPTPEQIVAEMNRERAVEGLKPLVLNEKLCLAAADRIRDMFAKRYFDHIAPDGLDPFTWVEKRGYDYRSIGENIAYGYPTAAATVHGWMTSQGHRENIMEKKYEEVGLAIVAGAPSPDTHGPIVVALYARAKPAAMKASVMPFMPSMTKNPKK